MTRTPHLLTAIVCSLWIVLAGIPCPGSSLPTAPVAGEQQPLISHGLPTMVKELKEVSSQEGTAVSQSELSNLASASTFADTTIKKVLLEDVCLKVGDLIPARLILLLRRDEGRTKRTVPFLLPLPFQQSSTSSRPSVHEEHDKAAASSIFRNLLRLSVSKANGTVPVPQELTFHEGQTIATIYTKIGEDSVHCNLIEVLTPEESDHVLKQFAQQNRRVLKTSFRTILAIITACQALDPDTTDVKNEASNSFVQFTTFATTTGRTENADRAVSGERLISQPQASQKPGDMWSVISGILPGTKWCGLGDIARDYQDLGPEKNLDKCCRAHDHCPTKLKALRSGYGLVNWSFYTKSHCECDSLLFDCLKKASHPTADMLGNFYFNILKVQCIDDEESKKCTVYDEVTHQCRSWEANPDASNKRMVFRNIPREF